VTMALVCQNFSGCGAICNLYGLQRRPDSAENAG
jgi:hypothetical protein